MMSSALDRLKNLMGNDTEVEVEDISQPTITEDEYAADVMQAINRRSSFEEVTLDEDTESENSLINDINSISKESDSIYEAAQTSITQEESIVDNSSIDNISNSEKEITINVIDTGDDSEEINEELFNNNTEMDQPKPRGRGRKRKNFNNDYEDIPTSKSMTKEEKSSVKIDSNRNPLYDQLVKNLIDDLRKQKYKFSGFNNESMEILFNYIQNKF